ncbi:hypothetical protein ABT040_35220 [Streptomyces sp. NPDC002688]|uniref:hypothetical protein n=1 Tax=Streptomyces sp. NPDC002688 TaxID=3154423 RepID=UPI0033226A35
MPSRSGTTWADHQGDAFGRRRWRDLGGVLPPVGATGGQGDTPLARGGDGCDGCGGDGRATARDRTDR